MWENVGTRGRASLHFPNVRSNISHRRFLHIPYVHNYISPPHIPKDFTKPLLKFFFRNKQNELTFVRQRMVNFDLKF